MKIRITASLLTLIILAAPGALAQEAGQDHREVRRSHMQDAQRPGGERPALDRVRESRSGRGLQELRAKGGARNGAPSVSQRGQRGQIGQRVQPYQRGQRGLQSQGNQRRGLDHRQGSQGHSQLRRGPERNRERGMGRDHDRRAQPQRFQVESRQGKRGASNARFQGLLGRQGRQVGQQNSRPSIRQEIRSRIQQRFSR